MKQSRPETSEALQERQTLVAAATAGDVGAQVKMGDVFREGDELTAPDLAEAVMWYRFAAAQGDCTAQNNIGAMFQNGIGVAKDLAEAARWYRLAAEQGFDVGQYNLGVLLGYGMGVPKDEPEAVALLHKAAAQGHIQACSLLGTLYRHGDGVDKRIATAAEFHVVAALEGDPDALRSLAEYHGEIRAEALGGSLLATLCLAKMHDRGLGIERSQTKMFAWLLWGERCGTQESESDVREELDDMRSFYSMTLSDAEKDEAAKQLQEMLNP